MRMFECDRLRGKHSFRDSVVGFSLLVVDDDAVVELDGESVFNSGSLSKSSSHSRFDL